MEEKIVLKAVGDIMLGDHPHYFGIGVRSRLDKTSIDIFEKVALEFQGSDILVGNLETVLSDCGNENTYQTFQLRGNPEYVKQLKSAGFNVLNLANNHALQHGEEAFLDSAKTLAQSGIEIIGLKRHSAVIFECKEKKFAFLAWNMRPARYHAEDIIFNKFDCEQIFAEIRSVRGKVDYVILTLHWGEEYMDYPSKEQVELAHHFIEAGVDVILGHHSHVLQGIEQYRGGIIAYSLGNFVSDMMQSDAKKTVILHLTFTGKDIEYQCVPCVINKFYQPEPVREVEEIEQHSHFLQELQQKALMAVDVPLDQYNSEVAASVQRFRQEFNKFFLRNFYRYPLKPLISNVLSALKRKLMR